MKKNQHPRYDEVAFRDRSGDLLLVTRSTLPERLPADHGAHGRPGPGTPAETVEVDGRTLPVVDVEVSSASHPFWTGRGRVVDTEGRVERFRRRYGQVDA
ncbi:MULTISPECIES: 50S ribosomal protein L31 [unclassified Aeromicrobium]|uniref:50S ribosomal protein L31 n=1 Tax=unclassified Aeromicrobium TaxID=2633570 RepID=UPI00288A2995|nr:MULTISPECIES: 50S ribosomal protein L31 [unclassified Aeromicrobium]